MSTRTVRTHLHSDREEDDCAWAWACLRLFEAVHKGRFVGQLRVCCCLSLNGVSLKSCVVGQPRYLADELGLLSILTFSLHQDSVRGRG